MRASNFQPVLDGNRARCRCGRPSTRRHGQWRWWVGLVAGGAALFVFAARGMAQAPPFEWVRQGGGASNDRGLAITTDVSSNLYVTGYVQDSASFGSTNLSNAYQTMFVGKYDSRGNVIWVRNAVIPGGNTDTRGQGIAVDGAGDVYVSGYFFGTINFGSLPLTGNGNSNPDAFLVKYNSAGNPIWARQSAAPAGGLGTAVAVTQNGSVHFVGRFLGTATFGSSVLTSAGQSDVFHVKYDGSGSVIWARKAGGTDAELGSGVAVDGNGNSYLTGTFWSATANFGGIALTNSRQGYSDIFVVKYDIDGNAIWARRAGSPTANNEESANGIAVDSAGNCFVTGCFWGTASFGNTNLVSSALGDIFVAKYDAQGALLWARRAGGASQAGDDCGYAISADATGNCYVVGKFLDTASFGTTNLVSGGLGDIFMAKYDPAGNVLWARKAGFIFEDVATGIALDVGGNAYVTGHFYDTATFDSTNLNGNVEEIFVGKLPAIVPVAPTIITPPVSQTVMAGATANFSVVAGGTMPLNYQWQFNGTNLSLATDAALTISNAQSANAGNYRVIVSNTGGATTSVVATLTVGLPPSITMQPQSQVVGAGSNTSFSITASGTAPLSFQWQFNGAPISGATNSTVTLNNAQPINGGNYTVVVTNSFGSETSSIATLTVRYSLVINVTGGGLVARAPNFTLYPPNTPVTLTATPSNGFAFNLWSGDASGSSNPLGLTMTSNKIITASFASTALTIGIQGQGMVGKSPDKPFYSAGEQVTLSTTPGRWFRFTGWGDGPTTNPRLVTIGLSNNYTAIFSPTTAVETLTFNNVSRTAPVGMPAIFVDGQFITNHTTMRNGSAQVEMLTTFPNGLLLYSLDGSPPSFFSALYSGPFSVRRTAILRSVAWDAIFSNFWEADPITIVIHPVYTLNTSTAGGGSIVASPAQATYLSNTVVALTAVPAPGWTFLQWLGDVNGTNPTNAVVMTRGKCVEAVFGTTLGVFATGGGAIDLRPNAPLYPFGTVVHLTGIPQSGNAFALWGNAGSGTNNPLPYAVTNANATVSAAFAPLSAGQYALTVLVNGFGSVARSPMANRFASGSGVTLLAAPDVGQQFLGWTGDASGTNNPLTVTMSVSKVMTAQFTRRPALRLQPCSEPALEDGFQFLISGGFGAQYEIQRNDDWQGWSLLGKVTNVFGVTQFNDPSATNQAHRYYRVSE